MSANDSKEENTPEHTRKKQKFEENAETEQLESNANGQSRPNELKDAEKKEDVVDVQQNHSENIEKPKENGKVDEKVGEKADEKTEEKVEEKAEEKIEEKAPENAQTEEKGPEKSESNSQTEEKNEKGNESAVSNEEKSNSSTETATTSVEETPTTTASSSSSEAAPAAAGQKDYSAGIRENIPTVRFDSTRISSLSEGDKEFESELIGMFRENLVERIPQLKESFKTQDEKMCRDYSHEIKGSAASIGAESLRFLCAQMETLSRNSIKAKEEGKTEEWAENLRQGEAYLPFLETEYEETCKDFDAYIA
eukprot:TRINITY_DN1211_c0_g1_i1.p1 TRINITY_DN1211_c0_g1~~TRINITY_DN1211_c0_g1_i1.p1  ORF type:complete len:309 (+),score=130.34 TRINITY_DN1211_c0_g1_i1:128-1054(+)